MVYNSQLNRNVFRIAFLLGWQDLRQAYRRSALGQFWLTIAMAIQIATMGVVFGLIFRTPLHTYLPYLAVSIIIWNFISNSINEGTLSLINSEGLIKQLPLSLFVYEFRSIWKQLIAFAHNFVLLPIVLIAFGVEINWGIFLFIPGLILLAANLTWVVFFLSTLSARFRDIPPIVGAVLTIAFYVTPVLWEPTQIPGGLASLLFEINPFFHFLQIVRLPLLGEFPTTLDWTFTLVTATVGLSAALALRNYFQRKVPFWV